MIERAWAERRYTCVDPRGGKWVDPGLPNIPWTDTTCNWLWLPELDRKLGAPRSWARWDSSHER